MVRDLFGIDRTASDESLIGLPQDGIEGFFNVEE
jgi:hypothetical protein